MTSQSFDSRTALALLSLGSAWSAVVPSTRAGEPQPRLAVVITQTNPDSAGMRLAPRRPFGPNLEIDPGIIVPANPNIDPRFLFARNPNIDRGIFAPRLRGPAPPIVPAPRHDQFRRFDRRRMPR